MQQVAKRSGLLLVLLLVVAAIGCGQKELSRPTAQELMNEEYARWLATRCAVNPLLAKKPEFANLIGKDLCDAEIVVTGMRRVSDAELVAEAKTVYHVNQAAVSEWLEAFDALEKRLLTLRAQEEFSQFHNPIWKFTDPTDNQTFTAIRGGSTGVGGPEDIKRTETWKRLQELKSSVAGWRTEADLEGDAIAQTFRLYDDGWRLVRKEEN